MTPQHTVALTTVTMPAFAANSLLCRLALQNASIDPASFGGVRLVSGALLLAAIVRWRTGPPAAARTDWLAGRGHVVGLRGRPLFRLPHPERGHGCADRVWRGAGDDDAALPRLTALRAATAQLSVPPIAAAGGALVLAELLSVRLLLSSAGILGGIALVLFSRSLAARPRKPHEDA